MTIRKSSKNAPVGKLDSGYQQQEPGRAGRPGWRKLVLYTLLTVAVAGIAWGLWVDLKIRSDFKALQWALPARIYARPAELYSGARISAAEFTAYLQRLGYRQSLDVAGPGEYRSTGANGSLVEVRTRGFQFWDGAEPSIYARVSFSGGSVASLRGTGNPIPLMRMEPVEIAQINPETGEDRMPVTLDEVPTPLLQAIVAVEDHRFYEHFGVDVRGILRALVTNLRAGEIVQGGSTLTQQLIKNLYLTRERTIRRKAEEALMALSLELHFSKDEILEAYVNEVHLGQEGNRAIHGFALAARHYFGRPLNELSLAELAVLAGLPRGASYYNPLRHPERATQRRNVVLARMHEQGFITQQELESATAEALEVAPQTRRAGYPAFMDLVYSDLASDYDSNALRTVGLRIFTTLDVAMQDAMEATISTSLARVEERLEERGIAGSGLETAVVIADTNSGDVRAVAGSREPGYTGFNRALRASRPIGSLAKPAVYLAALESGRFNLASVLSDRAVEIETPNGEVWRPGNFENETHGDVYLYDALERSMNLATVDLGMQVGLPNVAAMISRLGHTRPIQPYPSLVLGAVNMVPLEVAQMYQTLASNGFRSPLRAVEAVTTSRGEPLARYGVATEQIANPTSVFLLEYALQGSFSRGTARNSRNMLEDSMPLAGKTGTTNDLRDSWFAGYGDDLVGVVWVGHDDNSETGLTGSTGALRLWADIMRALDVQPRQSLPPVNVEWQRVSLDPVRRNCTETLSLPFHIDLPPNPAVSCETAKGGSLIEEVFDRFRDWRN